MSYDHCIICNKEIQEEDDVYFYSLEGKFYCTEECYDNRQAIKKIINDNIDLLNRLKDR